MWDQWEINGEPKPVDAFIRPWTDAPITVIGYELVKLQPDQSDDNAARSRNERESFFMIGSGIFPQPDGMLWLAPGETHAQRMWPAGTGQRWPSRTKALKGKYQDILDLHGVCFGGGPVQIFLTIYYTPEDDADTKANKMSD